MPLVSIRSLSLHHFDDFLVFLQLTTETPPLKLCATEVASAFWVSLDTFLVYGNQLVDTKAIQRKWDTWVEHYLSYIFPKCILEWLALDQVYFSAISLRPWIIYIQYAQDGSVSQQEREDPLWLWGLTLAATADLLQPVLEKRLDYPFAMPVNRFIRQWIPSKW